MNLLSRRNSIPQDPPRCLPERREHKPPLRCTSIAGPGGCLNSSDKSCRQFPTRVGTTRGRITSARDCREAAPGNDCRRHAERQHHHAETPPIPHANTLPPRPPGDYRVRTAVGPCAPGACPVPHRAARHVTEALRGCQALRCARLSELARPNDVLHASVLRLGSARGILAGGGGG
jgi:hypothetical protein